MRILSVDPGTSNIGICVFDYNITTHKLTIKHIENISGDKIFRMHKKTLPADFSKQFCTLDAIYLYMKKLILDHGPIDEIASEAAFKGAFAQAYAALLLSIHVVTMASRDTINKDIYKYAPKEVKLTMTNNGAADKDAIKEAVLMNNDIDLSAVDIHNHPSHIFDAIAVGYTHVTKKHKAN